MQSQNIIYLGVGLILGVLFGLLFFAKLVGKQVEKSLEEKKGQFVSLASHYLLTPISIIQTANSELQENDLKLTAAQRNRFYEIIQRGQQRLWIIAEQMLLVTEATKGPLRLNLTVASLSSIISDATTAVDIFAREKGVQIMVLDKTDISNQTRIDVRRMKQAVIALLDNAIKFSQEKNTVRVVLSFENGIVRIEVMDTGIGMDNEVIKHLSERFYRGNSLYSFDYQGIGLGLHIVKTIISAHGGELQFDSKPKVGTKAVIEFPEM